MRRRSSRGAAAKPPAPLLRLHRHSLASLLLLGGAEGQRIEAARAFHLSSPLRHGPFVVVDCARDEALLSRALEFWLIPGCTQPAVAPLREVEGGTLYLDGVECLSASDQRLLLALARRLQGGGPDLRTEPGPFRLAAGSATDLGELVERRRFSGPLYDSLDKIRLELGPVPRRGVA